jgi:hypothetical protein
MSEKGLPPLSAHADAKALQTLREGMVRLKSEGEVREHEIKQRRAAEAESRLADAQRQIEDLQKLALLLRASGDRKGLRELARQASQLGKRVAEDVALVGEGAMAASKQDPEGALANLNRTRGLAGAIAGQLRGLAALIDEDEDGKKMAEQSAKGIDESVKALPFREINERRAQKTMEKSLPAGGQLADLPAQGAVSLLV